MSHTTRRGFIGAAALAAPMFYVKNGWAKNKVINVGIYAGLMGDFLKKEVIAKFQSTYDCRVYATEGATLAQIAILRTQKDRPTFSAMFMDDIGVPIVRDEKLVMKLPADKMPNLANVFPEYITADGHGVGFVVSITAPFYNTKLAKPIESYAELWDPRFRGRYIMPTPKQTFMMNILVITAALVTGKPYQEAQYLIDDKVWAKLAELKPNVMTIYENNPAAVLQVAQGEALIGGPDHSKTIYPYKAKGADVDLCIPKEGAIAGVNCVTVVNNAPEPDLGAAFANVILDPGVQAGLAEYIYAAPTVRGLTIKKDVLQYLAYPESRVKELNLFMQDWSYFNPRRGMMIERFNQVFSS